MENHTLSYQEICFAILIGSHSIVCPYLSDIVVNAVKDCNPDEWKDVICSCFTDKVKPHVRQHLENNRPLTDFYAVCKLLRDRINDVAHFRGEPLLDPHERERLSLQVQGVETLRHWVFHGEQYVSAEEVRSSISLLFDILYTLSGDSDSAQLPRMKEKLSILYTYTDALSRGNADITYKLCPMTIGSALLHSSLKEFQTKGERYFHHVKDKNETKADKSLESVNRACKNQTGDDLRGLMKKVKNTISKGQYRRQLQEISSDIGQVRGAVMCDNILRVRNVLAHNEPLRLTEIRETLIYIRNLLMVLEVSCERMDSVLKTVRRLINEEDETVGYKHVKINCTDNYNNNDKFKPPRLRILRPRGVNFVGRVKEASIIKSVFLEKRSQTIRAVLVFGQAGMGKSFLAHEMTNELTRKYRTQVWVSCSNPLQLKQDLSHKGLSNFKRTELTDPLIVLDDVRSCTMDQIPQLIQQSGGSSIITTRSTLVKQFLQRVLQQVTVIDLKPFSIVESWELIKKKTKVFKFDAPSLASINKYLNNVLHNLPLCVSIYSSFVAFSTKTKRLDDVFKCSNNQPFVSWRILEERFGDRLHIRGLTGIVQSAETYLEDHPLVVFLLIKICSANSQNIPWLALTVKTSLEEHKLFSGREMDLEDYLILGLRLVTDWLFSEYGQTALEECRDTLEELGLIAWDSCTSTVSIHSLTLENVKNMLERRASFLDIFVKKAVLGLETSEMNKLKPLIDHLSHKISLALLFQMINRSLDVLLVVRKESLDYSEVGIINFIYDFLSKVVEDDPMQFPNDLLTRKILGELRFTIHTHLLRFPSLDLLHIKEIFGEKFIQGVPLEVENMKIVNNFCCLGNSLQLYGNCNSGCTEDYHLGHQAVDRAREDYYNLIYYLLRFALNVDCERGSTSRKDFLYKTSQRFGLKDLFETPNIDLLRKKIVDLSRKVYNPRDCPLCITNKENIVVRCWYITAIFRVVDSFEETGEVGNETLEILFLLIILCQQRQRLILDAVRDQTALQNHTAKSDNCCLLLDEARHESMLWSIQQRHGRCLRALVKTCNAIEKTILVNLQSVRNHNTSRFWRDDVHVILYILSSHLAFSAGWYFGTPRYFRAIRGFLKRTATEEAMHEHRRKSDLLSSRDILQERYIEANIDIISCWYDAVQTLFDSADLQVVLNMFIGAFERLLNHIKVYPGKIVGDHYFRVASVGLHNIACLSCISEETCVTVLETLERFQESTRQLHEMAWTSCLSENIAKIRALTNYGTTTVFKHFIESLRVFSAGPCLVARKTSLRSMREIWNLFGEKPIEFDCDGSRIPCVFDSMLFRVTRNIQQIYDKEMKYDAVEWFIAFRFQIAKAFLWMFLAGQFGFEYVQFLKDRGQWRDALERGSFLEQYYFDNFGDDYEEWLPEVPNITRMVKELKAFIQQNTGMRRNFANDCVQGSHNPKLQ